MPTVSKSEEGGASKRSAAGPLEQAHDQLIRILMMEDDQYYYRFVKRLLGPRDNTVFDVMHASSMADCEAHLAEDIPDVIIMDLCLPDSNGLETLRRVSAAAGGAPIVVLTASDDEETGLRAVGMGAQDFLVKHQVSNDSLVRSVRYAIERRKSEEATLRMAAIKDFTSTLGHDLELPLSAANSVIDALLQSEFGELAPPMVRVLKDLKENNTQQLQCVQKLLQVYKYETKHELQFENIDLKPIIVECCEKLRAEYSDNKPIKWSVEDDLPPVLGDPDALSVVFTNLIENAAKFGEAGKDITVTGRLVSGRACVCVHNFGRPIPEEGQKQLFQKFWQGVPGKWYTPHTGIGLYLCNRIVMLHRGKITCDSNPDTGTAITVKLPI
ncbi:MAG TPA: hybrid sensor histidine kinase/response regulator [Candidatus Obscuribacterales bacterium]